MKNENKQKKNFVGNIMRDCSRSLLLLFCHTRKKQSRQHRNKKSSANNIEQLPSLLKKFKNSAIEHRSATSEKRSGPPRSTLSLYVIPKRSTCGARNPKPCSVTTYTLIKSYRKLQIVILPSRRQFIVTSNNTVAFSPVFMLPNKNPLAGLKSAFFSPFTTTLPSTKVVPSGIGFLKVTLI